MDKISHLPDHLVDMILNHLPLCDVVRTSLLSKSWRYQWRNVSKLSLDSTFFDTWYGQDQEAFEATCRNVVENILGQYVRPLQHEVTGFPNLKSFCLKSIGFSDLDKLCSFISSCPQLRRIQLENLNNIDQNLYIHAPRLEELSVVGRFRTISLKEAQELLYLYIQLEDINEDIEQSMASNNTMLHLFSNLGKLKYIKLGSYICRVFYVPREFSKALRCLKTIELFKVDLGHRREFHCLLWLIRNSPNLQQLKITVVTDKSTPKEPHFLPDIGDCADCCFECLRTVTMINVSGTKVELKIIEILFKRSPVLEVMLVDVDTMVDDYAIVEVEEEMMRYDRASRIAELVFATDDPEDKVLD